MRQYISFIFLCILLTIRFYYICGININDCSDRKLENNIPEFIQTPSNKIRQYATKGFRKYFPSPHSELLLGMVLGIDDFNYVPRFKEALKDTGTIHVVVVSGYNISLVFDLVIRIIGTKNKIRNLVIAQFITFIYSLLSGFEPPVIRAWIMGTIVSWGKYYDRGLKALRILIFSGLLMCIFNPLYLFNMSFQLSFMATLSLILYSNPMDKFFKKIISNEYFIIKDLSTTLSAQVLVWPIISYYFGKISLISPLVNCLLLWTVPISTILGGIFLFTFHIHSIVAQFIFLLVLPALDIFVQGILFFSRFKHSVINLQISIIGLFIYYIGIIVIPQIYKRRTNLYPVNS